MIHIISPPEYPEPQLQAAIKLAERAYQYRQSYAGQDFVKRRDAAKRELRGENAKLRPLARYALKRKASLAAYELKRGRANG